MKVLFVRFSSLGDIVLTSGIIKKFKEQYPEAQIAFLTYESFKDIPAMIPGVSQVLTIPRTLSPNQYLSFIKNELSSFDRIFDLHANLRSRAIFFFNPQKYRSYSKQSLLRRLFIKLRFLRPFLKKHVVEKYAHPVGISYSQIEELRPLLKVPPSEICFDIILHPFASKQTKQWPYFDKLAQALIKRGFSVAVIGHTTQHSLKFPPQCQNLINATSIKQMVQTINNSKLLITTDSGPLHIGIATSTPTLSIFGPTTKEFGFYPEFHKTFVLEIPLSCRPCHPHGPKSCPQKHWSCMNRISVQMVENKALEILKNLP